MVTEQTLEVYLNGKLTDECPVEVYNGTSVSFCDAMYGLECELEGNDEAIDVVYECFHAMTFDVKTHDYRITAYLI